MGAGHWMKALALAGAEMPQPPTAEAQLAQLLERRRVYIEYARHRIDDEDWHGCSDAANDLRELDVEIRMHRSHHGL